MTATLSPERESTLDDETISDLEEHKDDQPSCGRCDAPATVRLISRCCGYATLQCDLHHQHERNGFAERIATNGARCRTCFHDYRKPDRFEDFLKVVPL